MLIEKPNTYVDRETIDLLEKHKIRGRNLGSLLYARAAETDGATIEWHSSNACVATYRDARVLIHGYITNQSQVGAKVVEDKFLTKNLLQEAGVSVPRGWVVDSPESAVAVLSRTDRPLVIKPRAAYGGKGVSVGLRTSEEVISAYSNASLQGTGVLAEELIVGTVEYRCIATPDECLSVVRRILPNVTGDGRSTIRELISEKNRQRELNPSTYNRYTPIDAQTEACLYMSGLHLEDILELGRTVTVRNVGGLSSGGEPAECSDQVSSVVKEVAIAAVKAVPGLTWGGCDVLVEESTGVPYIIEINSSADITGSMFPYYGRPKDVALAAWKARRQEEVSRKSARASGVGFAASQTSTVEAARPDIWRNDRTLRLASILRRAAEGLGYQFGANSSQIFQVFDDDNNRLWFTSDMAGVRDLAVVRRALRRHRTVRSLLRSHDVARVSGRVVWNVSDIEVFLGGMLDDKAVLIPPRQEWASRSPQIVSRTGKGARTDVEPRGWVVQAHPAGRRVRVFATPSRCLWALGDPGDASFETETVARCGRLAMKAVDSVPGLRWAAVDIVVAERLRPDGTHRLLVEGVATNPIVSRESVELGGSLEALVDKVIRG